MFLLNTAMGRQSKSSLMIVYMCMTKTLRCFLWMQLLHLTLNVILFYAKMVLNCGMQKERFLVQQKGIRFSS